MKANLSIYDFSIKKNTSPLFVRELITKPIIRNDQLFECFNKMTDEEIALYKKSDITENMFLIAYGLFKWRKTYLQLSILKK